MAMSNDIHVIHIDDEPDFANLTAAKLEREDDRFTVQAATSVKEGLDLLDERTDCILSDYHLPDGTGLDILEVVREEYPELPVVMFTDTGSEEVASRAISAGVTDYLIKDVVTEQYGLLASKIVTVIEKRRADKRATELEQYLHELANQASDVLYIFEGDWSEVLFINAAFETVFEHPVETVKDDPTSFLDAIHSDDRERVAMAMERVSGGQFIRIDYRIDTAGGDDKWVESHAKPIIQDGEVVRIVGYTRDITELKAKAKELERKNDQLERFASVVAHDLRNPWNVANGFLDIVRSKDDSEELERVSDALTRMNQIITNLLELAKAGATIDDVESISLRDIADQSWKTVANSNAELNIENDITVQGDRTRLNQVFENLFRNAIEHGGDDVTITVGVMEDTEGWYVEDDGPGIPATERRTVLERGYSTSEAGTGFGLAIVQEIIEAHGWSLQITAGTDGGARFEVTGVEHV